MHVLQYAEISRAYNELTSNKKFWSSDDTCAEDPTARQRMAILVLPPAGRKHNFLQFSVSAS
jgi:hypothetical protein